MQDSLLVIEKERNNEDTNLFCYCLLKQWNLWIRFSAIIKHQKQIKNQKQCHYETNVELQQHIFSTKHLHIEEESKHEVVNYLEHVILLGFNKLIINNMSHATLVFYIGAVFFNNFTDK